MYCGYITELKDLRKHSNADKLQLCTVFGNTVIVDLSYYEGQKVVFFPVDGQLGKEYAEENNLLRIKNEDGTYSGGYLDAKKRNIKAMKLRGEKSEGLVLPVESLSKWTDISKLKIGEQITALDGTVICQKYIPRGNHSNKSGKSGTISNLNRIKEKYLTFHEHADTEQLAYNLDRFKPGDTCYITLKMHGTSARTAVALKEEDKKQNFIQRLLHKPVQVETTWVPVSGTRRVVLEDYSGGFYGSNEFRRKYHDYLKDKLPKGLTVYYEIVGWVDGTDQTIMGRCPNNKVKDKAFSKLYGNETVFSYGCEPGTSDIYVYRMTMTNEDDTVIELPWEVVKIWCERLGLKHVPEFDKFLFTTKEDLIERVEKYYDGPDPIGKTHVREGVVVRIDNRESFTAYKHKNFAFKVLEGIIKDSSDTPDMEEAQEIVEEESL